jgi:phosphoribosylanthranilate isomerase
MIWTKICGTTNLADAQKAVAAGAHAVGFVFAPSSRQISQEAAAEIVAALPANVAKIGVMVNQSPEDLARLAQDVGLTGIQLQGDESADQLWAYRSALEPRKIIKTLQVQQVLAAGDDYLQQYLNESEFFDAVLLDSGTNGQRGGTGVTFDWKSAAPVVARIKQWLPVIVAGGLSPDNVTNAIQTFAPWGVDVVSGVETEPGHKDAAKVNAFVTAARSASSDTAPPRWDR